jgi:hypothetical protein
MESVWVGVLATVATSVLLPNWVLLVWGIPALMPMFSCLISSLP